MAKFHPSRPWLLLLISLLFSGCMALPFLIPPLIEFGANLLTTAFNNYGNFHKQNMSNLLTSLQQTTNPNLQPGSNANPYGQTGGYQQPGYPNQDYQTAQGYPSSPDYSQQGYDPYQTQTPQPQYGESTPYSNGPYPNEGLQGQSYPNNSGYPNQQATGSGYPTSQQPYDPYQTQQPQYGGNTPYSNTPYPNQDQQGQPYPNNSGYPNQQATNPGYSSYPQNQYPQQTQQANAYPNNQNIYPNQNPYPNQGPYSNQPPSPAQGHPYPDTSNSMGQQGQSTPTPYGNTETASAPAYQNQPNESAEYQNTQLASTQAAAAPISLDVLLVKKHVVNGLQSYLPIKDGDILLDGRGDPQAGDKFRVMFRAKTDCYVYVIAVDGSAWAQGLFPSASSPFANPVKAGQQHVLPEGNNWFSLDQFKGIETVFVVASHARRQDIEEILSTITGRERHPADKPQGVSEPAIIPNGYSGTRPSSSPFAFQTSPSQQQELLPTTYFVKTAGENLRITRWFRHQ